MAEHQPQHAKGGDRFAWIDPGVSVWDEWGAVPPPPKVPPTTSARVEAPRASSPPQAPKPAGDPEPLPEPSSEFDPPPAEQGAQEPVGPPTFHEFDAELDVGELDERLRPVTTWTARATSVNRSSLSFKSRRMCYAKKMLIIAVHLIDDKPTVLAGRVTECDYIGEGLYQVDVELMPKPESEDIRAWEAQR